MQQTLCFECYEFILQMDENDEKSNLKKSASVKSVDNDVSETAVIDGDAPKAGSPPQAGSATEVGSPQVAGNATEVGSLPVTGSAREVGSLPFGVEQLVGEDGQPIAVVEPDVPPIEEVTVDEPEALVIDFEKLQSNSRSDFGDCLYPVSVADYSQISDETSKLLNRQHYDPYDEHEVGIDIHTCAFMWPSHYVAFGSNHH